MLIGQFAAAKRVAGSLEADGFSGNCGVENL